MYVPPNIAPSGTTYATVTPLQAPAAAQSQDISGARQTQIAVTGPGAALISNSVGGRPAVVIQPRPAYIAAQFLAQNVTPEEAEQFFSPQVPSPALTSATREQAPALRAQNETVSNPQIAARQTTTSAAAQAPIAIAQPVVQRNAFVQAYNASNARNALLASTPEVDTSL